MHPQRSSKWSQIGLLLTTALLFSLSSCAEYDSGPGLGVMGTYSGNSYSPPYTSGYGYGYAGYNGPSNYSYYPRYRTYYNQQSRQYYYQQGSTWQTRRSPYGVSSRTLLASPYIPLNLHSNPSNHHHKVSQSYPHNWSPPGQGHSSHSGSSHKIANHSSSSNRRR